MLRGPVSAQDVGETIEVDDVVSAESEARRWS